MTFNAAASLPGKDFRREARKERGMDRGKVEVRRIKDGKRVEDNERERKKGERMGKKEKGRNGGKRRHVVFIIPRCYQGNGHFRQLTGTSIKISKTFEHPVIFGSSGF